MSEPKGSTRLDKESLQHDPCNAAQSLLCRWSLALSTLAQSAGWQPELRLASGLELAMLTVTVMTLCFLTLRPVLLLAPPPASSRSSSSSSSSLLFELVCAFFLGTCVPP